MNNNEKMFIAVHVDADRGDVTVLGVFDLLDKAKVLCNNMFIEAHDDIDLNKIVWVHYNHYFITYPDCDSDVFRINEFKLNKENKWELI